MKSLVALGLSLVSLVFLYIIKIKSNIYIYYIYNSCTFFKRNRTAKKRGQRGQPLSLKGYGVFKNGTVRGQQTGQKTCGAYAL